MKKLTFSDLSSDIDEVYKHGLQPGRSFGFDQIDDYYTYIPGNCTDITGYPYMGKTLLAAELLYQLATRYGVRSALYMPDSGRREDVAVSLIRKHTGKSFLKQSATRITEAELHRAKDELSQWFTFIEAGHRAITPQEFFKTIAEDSNVDAACIDSWNYMNIERTTDALADALAFRNIMAQDYGKHFYTVIHPRNPTASDYDKDNRLRVPDVYNLMGGSEWNNNGKNIIVVHKDNKESDWYDIYFRKIKPRNVGKTGMCTLKFNRVQHKFINSQTETEPPRGKDAALTPERDEWDGLTKEDAPF